DDDLDLELVEELLNVGGTTGRGLQLVDRLSSDWGYDLLPDSPGKTVWAVIGAGPAAPRRAGTDLHTPEAPPVANVPMSHPVRIVAVPVWLALESELHLETLVREFQ